jgi:XTP/dITP diphosphohydrolase
MLNFWNSVIVKKPLLYCTTNRDKQAEVRALAGSFDLAIAGIDYVDRRECGEPPIVIEDSPLYEVNAVRKALAYARWAGLSSLADDTGIEVDDLGGYPGVYTARVGVHALREKLRCGVRYAAHFVCCMAYAEPTGRRVAVSARLPGVFMPGLGGKAPSTALEFSPYFVPEGESRSLQELLAEGYSDSHRARALRALLRSLS